MAFLNNDQTDPEIMNFGTPATQGGGGGTISRGAGGGSMSFGGGGADKGQTASGSFTNLQGYLKANEGAGSGMVDAATRGAQDAYSNVTSGVNKELQSMSTPVASFVAPTGYSPNNFVQKDGYDPLKISSVSPMNFSTNYSGDISKVSDALAGANVGGAAWGKSLSNNMPTATGGGHALNAFLMGNDPSAKSRTSELKDQWGGLAGWLSGKQSQEDSAASAKNAGIDSYNKAVDAWRNAPQTTTATTTPPTTLRTHRLMY